MKPNFLVLGADGTGKDTLCSELGKKLETEPIKFPGRVPESLGDAFERAMLAADGVKPYSGTIWNRFYYPDDLIYGQVMRQDDEEFTRYWREEFRNNVIPLLKKARFHVILLRISTATAQMRGVLQKPNDVEKDIYHNMQWWQWNKLVQLYNEEVLDFLRYQLPTRLASTDSGGSPIIVEDLLQMAIVSETDPRWTSEIREHTTPIEYSGNECV